MPTDDYLDLCTLLSLEPSPDGKFDILFANLMAVTANAFGGKVSPVDFLPPWSKLGQPPTIEDRVNKFIADRLAAGDKYENVMEAVGKLPEVIAHNAKLFGKKVK